MHAYFPFLMASVFAISPLAVDMYLPTLPTIANDMGVGIESISITVSLYIFGLSLGHFVGGPISDYKGRRPVLFVGLLIFFFSSLLLALTDSLTIFWIGRVLQAIGGGLSAVVIPAMIRDRITGQEAAKLFALIALITIFVPAMAPSLGTLVYHLSGWRAIFIAMAVYSILILFLTWKYLNMPVLPRKNSTEGLLQRYKFVLLHKTAMRYVLAHGLAFSVMMIFVTNAALLYIEHYHVTENLFSILFAVNIITMMLFNRLNNWLLNKKLAASIIIKAIGVQFMACLAIFLITPLAPKLIFIVPIIMVATGALGAIMGNSQACCLHFFPNHSGVASSLLGSGQYLMGSLISGISTLFHSELMWPMASAMLISSLLALLIIPKDISVFQEEMATN